MWVLNWAGLAIISSSPLIDFHILSNCCCSMVGSMYFRDYPQSTSDYPQNFSFLYGVDYSFVLQFLRYAEKNLATKSKERKPKTWVPKKNAYKSRTKYPQKT